MNPSPASIGIAMIGFALIGPAMALRTGGAPLTLLSCFAALPLLLGGAAMFVRRRESFFVAIAGAGIMVLSAVVGMLLKREVGLPISPVLALVIGLYASFRVVMARDGLGPRTARRSIADELAAKLATNNGDDEDEPATRPFVRRKGDQPIEADRPDPSPDKPAA